MYNAPKRFAIYRVHELGSLMFTVVPYARDSFIIGVSR